MNKCDNCLRLEEANKLKIPVITVPVDTNKNEIRWCKACYQKERQKTSNLFDICQQIYTRLMGQVDIDQWNDVDLKMLLEVIGCKEEEIT